MVFQNYNKDALIGWYDEHSGNYDKESFTQDAENYGGDLYRIKIVSKLIDKYKIDSILDIGCGTAEPMLHFLKKGIQAEGFDLSPGMAEQAKAKLVKNGFDGNAVCVGDLLSEQTLSRYKGKRYKAVITNGVIPYIKDVDLAHKNVSSLISPGNYYIGAYSNRLMDLFTFNRFTTRFFQDSFVSTLSTDEGTKEKIMEGVRSLMKYPDEPKYIKNSARNEIYVESSNPLTIGEDLKRVGLNVKEILFYKFHAFPPLLGNLIPELAPLLIELSRKYEVEQANDWRGYFLASTFIVVAQKE